MLKRIVSVMAMVIAGVGVSLGVAAPAQACGTVVDIGYTVLSNGYVKGSGSYTSESCLAIDVVYLVIQKDGSNMSETTIYRYPSEPSSAAFSPKDHSCGTASWHDYRTVINWTYQGGGGGQKISNTIHVQC